jgi:hypothetical protein
MKKLIVTLGSLLTVSSFAWGFDYQKPKIKLVPAEGNWPDPKVSGLNLLVVEKACYNYDDEIIDCKILLDSQTELRPSLEGGGTLVMKGGATTYEIPFDFQVFNEDPLLWSISLKSPTDPLSLPLLMTHGIGTYDPIGGSLSRMVPETNHDVDPLKPYVLTAIPLFGYKVFELAPQNP